MRDYSANMQQKQAQDKSTEKPDTSKEEQKDQTEDGFLLVNEASLKGVAKKPPKQRRMLQMLLGGKKKQKTASSSA